MASSPMPETATTASGRLWPWACAIGLIVAVGQFGTHEWAPGPLAFPLATLQVHGKAVAFLALLAFLGLLLLRWRRSLPDVRIPRSPFFLAWAAFAVVLHARTLSNSDSLRDLLALVLSLAWPAIGLLALHELRHRGSTSAMPHLVAGAIAWSGLWALAAMAFQGLIDPHAMYNEGRMFGITGHANHLGVWFSGVFLVCLGLWTERTPVPGFGRRGLPLLALAAIAIVAASGSRTAMLAVATGVIHASVASGRPLLAATFTAILAALAAALLLVGTPTGDRLADPNRLLSTENTRVASWDNMTQSFLEHPMIGTGGESGREDRAFGESSPLATLAVCGLLGGIPLAAAMAAWMATLVRWAGRRRSAARMLGPLSCGLLVASIFEGFLIQTLLASTVCIHLIAFSCAAEADEPEQVPA